MLEIFTELTQELEPVLLAELDRQADRLVEKMEKDESMQAVLIYATIKFCAKHFPNERG